MKSLRIFLYCALALVSLLLWNAWQREYGLESQKPVATQASTQSVAPSATHNATLPPSTTASAPVTPLQSAHVKQSVGKTISIETDVLHLTVGLNGGNLVSAVLPQYTVSTKSTTPVTLLTPNADKYYAAQSGLTNVPGLGNKPIPFSTQHSKYTLSQGENVLHVNLVWQNAGFKIIKTYTLTRGRYDVQIGYHVINNSIKPWSGQLYLQTQQKNVKPKSDHLMGFHTFFGAALSTPEKPYEKIAFKKLDETPVDQAAKGGWFAFVQHYFLTAWVPAHQESYTYYSKSSDNDIYTLGALSPMLTLNVHASDDLSSQLYIGPKIASNLKQVAPHLQLTIDYGWLWMIAVVIFWLLKHIEILVGNWGWSIILVTILIKAVFYKLSATSYVSMAKMRALQPKMNELKERFSDDRQQLNKAVMELYRREKVNPLGGCLPILIQIPVFIALYWVLVESVELRQAPFILWIHDLSAPDPYFILPVIMGFTMFLQQKLSPKPADPMQAKVMMFLPVFFTFLFLKFPSGLVLYWVVNNSASILQQWYIMRRYNQGAYQKSSKKPKKTVKRVSKKS